MTVELSKDQLPESGRGREHASAEHPTSSPEPVTGTLSSNPRDAFEAWVQKEHPNWWPNGDGNGRRWNPSGFYTNKMLHAMWLAWEQSSKGLNAQQSSKGLPDETTAPRELTDAESIERKERAGQNRSHTTRFSLMEGERGAFIDDDEFTYDALLKVQGDFEDDATRRAYMQAICDVLNEHEDRIPWRQPEKS